MVINYKQMQEKREQLKVEQKKQRDLTPLLCMAQRIIDAYKKSLELPGETWTDERGNTHDYVSCGTGSGTGFTRMPLSEVTSALPVIAGKSHERKLTFTIETVVDTTPGEVASVFTPLCIKDENLPVLTVTVAGKHVPLQEGENPCRTVCESIQYHVMREIEKLTPGGQAESVQLWD
ncbi:hypothetical protein D3J17_004477 [Escherichia coli]|nr:hypothetical protein [Escherichia coli]